MQHELDATDQEHIYVLKDLDHKVKMNCLKRESFDMCMYEMHFFCTSGRFSLLAAGLFSRSRLLGTPGAGLYSRGKFWPGPCSVARALGVQAARAVK